MGKLDLDGPSQPAGTGPRRSNARWGQARNQWVRAIRPSTHHPARSPFGAVEHAPAGRGKEGIVGVADRVAYPVHRVGESSCAWRATYSSRAAAYTSLRVRRSRRASRSARSKMSSGMDTAVFMSEVQPAGEAVDRWSASTVRQTVALSIPPCAAAVAAAGAATDRATRRGATAGRCGVRGTGTGWCA